MVTCTDGSNIEAHGGTAAGLQGAANLSGVGGTGLYTASAIGLVNETGKNGGGHPSFNTGANGGGNGAGSGGGSGGSPSPGNCQGGDAISAGGGGGGGGDCGDASNSHGGNGADGLIIIKPLP
jgi:hypothetical protein